MTSLSYFRWFSSEALQVARWRAGLDRNGFARDNYEVIVVSPGGSPKTEEPVRSRLGSGDRLVAADTDNLYALYDLGIRHSRGRVVMITESHVVATHDCLNLVVKHLDERNDEAVCCNAVAPKTEGYLAAMEAMLFAEESRLARGPGKMDCPEIVNI